MMKKLVSELSGAEMDYWVGLAEEQDFYKEYDGQEHLLVRISDNLITWHPSTNPAQGWPIIEREKIVVIFNKKEQCWFSGIPNTGNSYCHDGETSLIAAMRCRVASVYGETVGDDD